MMHALAHVSSLHFQGGNYATANAVIEEFVALAEEGLLQVERVEAFGEPAVNRASRSRASFRLP